MSQGIDPNSKGVLPVSYLSKIQPQANETLREGLSSQLNTTSVNCDSKLSQNLPLASLSNVYFNSKHVPDD